MSNIVYVLTNEAMPGIVKIGKTTGDSPQVRMKSLYGSGVPLPFECAFAVKVGDEQATILERALHTAFAPDRLNESREFFWIEAERATAILRAWPEGEDVTPDVTKEDANELDALDVEAVRKAKGRRPNFNFGEMGIPPKSVIVSIHTDEEATVLGDRKVSFRKEEMFLTNATRFALGLKPEQNSVAPCPHWTYEGRNLSDIFEETYGTQET